MSEETPNQDPTATDVPPILATSVGPVESFDEWFSSVGGIPDDYVDTAIVTTTSFTTTISFGAIGLEAPRSVTPIMRVRMSPHHAKALALHIITVVVGFEAIHGRMNIPGVQTDITIRMDSGKGAADGDAGNSERG